MGWLIPPRAQYAGRKTRTVILRDVQRYGAGAVILSLLHPVCPGLAAKGGSEPPPVCPSNCAVDGQGVKVLRITGTFRTVEKN